MCANHIADRDEVLKALKEELLGPAPAGTDLDLSGPVAFAQKSDSFGPFRQAGSGEEILRDPPSRRYGVGVLYPYASRTADISQERFGDREEPRGDDLVSATAQKELENIQAHAEDHVGAADEEDDFDLAGANAFRQSSMAVSFLVRISDSARLILRAQGGRYRPVTVAVEGRDREWWLRSPVSITAVVEGRALLRSDSSRPAITERSHVNCEGLDLAFEVYSRRQQTSDELLVTVSLINRSQGQREDVLAMFQSTFEVCVETDGVAGVVPYPSPPLSDLDPEEQGLELLYRRNQTFAIGHGCAADWGDVNDSVTHVVRAVALPTFETPSMTPTVIDADGKHIAVSMRLLSVESEEAIAALSHIVSLYRSWIADRQLEIATLPTAHRPTAERHLAACLNCASRMEHGVAFLRDDARARRAFALANRAILFQHLNSGRQPRWINWTAEGAIEFAEAFTPPSLTSKDAHKPAWRAFQIAFMLMALRSSALGNDVSREQVDLIWFPTGGGKTEAYLGLAAFAAFYRRLLDPADDGVLVLMRYTLRLLTAQQFQRSARLVCAMEALRRESSAELGEQPFSIGIWLGGDTTPNLRRDAVAALRKLKAGEKYSENPFLVDRCPWCRAEMGVIKNATRHIRVVGYEQAGSTVIFRCADPRCQFSSGMPVFVIDEDVYTERPTIVIGTVDKFASLAWRPEARAIFGVGESGDRICSPPGLIIQDELHLISGPLGSMVGLYEQLVEELATDYRTEPPVRPKIVCSTATIRRYEAQVRSLYARSSTQLFPPPGIDAEDSFFARYARDSSGNLERGRLYVGIHAPGLGSIQTAQVRSFAAVLAAPLEMDAEARDPWWTLLLFFNSLRELGGTVSLLQSDIPDYLKTIRSRSGGKETRYLNHVLELTSRLTREEVPRALSSLEVTTTTGTFPVDVCLASNIIEVGVDIDRLSLMAVVGQPKTTAQYIQVSGRVGRQWKERPGLVLTIYGAGKARDRSHYERFRSYHERLYAGVEPTSVTPFSMPVVDRALHAVMAAFVRQTLPTNQEKSPTPCPVWSLNQLEQILRRRVGVVDPDEQSSVGAAFLRRLKEWERWQPRIWSGSPDGAEIPLLRPAGGYAPLEWLNRSWPTPQSMRSVDAECQAEITQLYS